MTDKIFGNPLTYSKTETIAEDTVLVSGQYYIFRKEKEIVWCTFREQVERAIDPVGFKEDFVKKMQSDYNETPRILYVKISYSSIDDRSVEMGRWLINDYAVEIHFQDTGVVTAAIIIAVAVAVILIGSFLMASWTMVKVLDAAEGVGGDFGLWGTGLVILLGFFILAVLLISRKAEVSKKGLKLG